MAVELKNIIEKIKAEGVDAAEEKAAGILAEAEDKAGKIIASAEKKAEEIVKKAEQESAKTRENAEKAIKQASRDVVLGLKQDIISLFGKVTRKKVDEQLSDETMKQLLLKLVDNFKGSDGAGVEILLSEEDKDAMEKLLMEGLGKELRRGVTLKASPSMESGFRIGETGEDSYYDFTGEAVTEAFKAFLNPKIARLLDPAENGDK